MKQFRLFAVQILIGSHSNGAFTNFGETFYFLDEEKMVNIVDIEKIAKIGKCAGNIAKLKMALWGALKTIEKQSFYGFKQIHRFLHKRIKNSRLCFPLTAVGKFKL